MATVTVASIVAKLLDTNCRIVKAAHRFATGAGVLTSRRRRLRQSGPLQETELPQVGKLHALSTFQPILDLANAKVTNENYMSLLFGFLPPSRRKGIEIGVLGLVSDPVQSRIVGGKILSPFSIPHEVIREINSGRFVRKSGDTLESVLQGCYRLGRKLVDPKLVAELRERVVLVLKRYLKGDPDPLRAGAEFVISSRFPLRNPSVIRAEDGAFDPDTNDLQDIWYGYLSHLLARLGDSRPLVLDYRGQRKVLPFRPIARCPICKCFFFRAGGPRQITCGVRRCVDRQAHKPRPKPPRAPSPPA